MRTLAVASLVFACGCSTAPIAGFLDWVRPTPPARPLGDGGFAPPPVRPDPVTPAPVRPDPTPVPSVFDPTRRRREPIPATPAPRSDDVPPPAVTSDPATPAQVLPAPAFPDA